MKKIYLIPFIIAMASSFATAQDLTPQQIIRKIDETERVVSSRSKIRQVITTSSGKKRTLEMETWAKDRNDKQLMVYTAPKRVKGDKILMLNDGDDIWFFTPKTDRVRHLASHAKKQKVQGSDFAYEDMSGGEIEKDYTYELLGEENIDNVQCYKFKLIPTATGPSYAKLILWADKEKFLTMRIDYYEPDEILKRLRMDDVHNIDGHWTPFKMVMKNLQDGSETVMETIEIEFDIEIADKLFTTKNLKRR